MGSIKRLGPVRPFVTSDKKEYEKRKQAFADSAMNYFAAKDFERIKLTPGDSPERLAAVKNYLGKYHDRTVGDWIHGYLFANSDMDGEYMAKPGLIVGDEVLMHDDDHSSPFSYDVVKLGDKSMMPVQKVEYRAPKTTPKPAPRPVVRPVVEEKPKTYNYEVSREVQYPNTDDAQIWRILVGRNEYNLNPDAADFEQYKDPRYMGIPQPVTDSVRNAWNERFRMEPYTKEMTEDEAKELEKQGYTVRRYDFGGPVRPFSTAGIPLDVLIASVRNSDAEFAKRLSSRDTSTMADWGRTGYRANYKMGSSDNIVYPNVVKENGRWTDFTRPPYSSEAGYYNAINTGNYVEMPSERDAIWFGKNYKYIPEFRNESFEPKFAKGGLFNFLKNRDSYNMRQYKKQARERNMMYNPQHEGLTPGNAANEEYQDGELHVSMPIVGKNSDGRYYFQYYTPEGDIMPDKYYDDGSADIYLDGTHATVDPKGRVRFPEGAPKNTAEHVASDVSNAMNQAAPYVAGAVALPLISAISPVAGINALGANELFTYIPSGEKFEKTETPTNINDFESSQEYYSVPTRNNTDYLNEYFEKKTREEAEKYAEDLKTKDKDEIKKVQRELADSGYYDNIPIGTDIKELQKKLVKRGFLDNSDGKAIDGVYGPKTRRAYREYNVDGIIGDRTKQAITYQALNNMDTDMGGFEEYVPTGSIKNCAQWVTKKYENARGNVSKSDGVFGNAWQMPYNVVNAGGKMIYNAYDDPSFDNVKTVSELKSATNSYLKNNPVDVKQLKVGDIVGMYFGSSTHHGDVLREGTTYNTHVGIVTGYDSKGTPIIQHNMGGKLMTDPANKLSYGARISVVARPRRRDNVSELEFKGDANHKTVDYAEQEWLDSSKQERRENMDKFLSMASGSRGIISDIFPGVDMNLIEDIAIGILGTETGFMRQDMQVQAHQMANKAGRMAKSLLKGEYDKVLNDENRDDRSTKLAKLKLRNFSPSEQKMLGIHSATDLENPEKLAPAMMYLLAKNYDYFLRLREQNPSLGITDEDIINATILSYNQGLRSLSTLGFDKTGKKNEQELEQLRNIGGEDSTVESDISSTNYKYLGELGKFLYDEVGLGPHNFPSYIAKTKKHMSKINN